jgi:hypothetical protein
MFRTRYDLQVLTLDRVSLDTIEWTETRTHSHSPTAPAADWREAVLVLFEFLDCHIALTCTYIYLPIKP